MRVRVPALMAVVVISGSSLVACSNSAKKTASLVPTTTTGTVPSGTPATLTASFRGVTATSIKVGIVTINYDCIKQFVDYN